MADSFIVRWPGLGKQVRCDKIRHNQNVFDWFVDQMPLRAVEGHTAVSGWCLRTCTVRTKTPPTWEPGSEAREDISLAPDGTMKIRSNPISGDTTILIKYDVRTENLSDMTFARVREADVPTLREVGAAVWKAMIQTKDVIFVEYVAAEEAPEVISWQQVAEETQAAADRIQFGPGNDFKKAVVYRIIESGAGNEKNCFAPWWFSLGDARHLGMYLYFAIFFAVDNDSFTLEQLKTVARSAEEPLAFCGYCGLREFAALGARVIAALDSVNTKEELIELLKPLRLYAAYVNQWSYHYFPYTIGYVLPLLDEAYFEEGLRYARMP